MHSIKMRQKDTF